MAVVVAREDVARRRGLGLGGCRALGSTVMGGLTVFCSGLVRPRRRCCGRCGRVVGWIRSRVWLCLRGTGTRQDPVEVNALVDAFGGGARPGARWCRSPNVGHPAGGVGSVGLVVLACALRDGQVPERVL